MLWTWRDRRWANRTSPTRTRALTPRWTICFRVTPVRKSCVRRNDVFWRISVGLWTTRRPDIPRGHGTSCNAPSDAWSRRRRRRRPRAPNCTDPLSSSYKAAEPRRPESWADSSPDILRRAASNLDPFDLVEIDLVVPAIIELRGACAGVVRHRSGLIEAAAAVLQIGCDPGRPERVFADLRGDASRSRAPANHT